MECQKALYFVIRGDAGRGVGWDRVASGGGDGGDSDVNLKSAHAKTIGIHSILCDFAWVRRVPPLPSYS